MIKPDWNTSFINLKKVWKNNWHLLNWFFSPKKQTIYCWSWLLEILLWNSDKAHTKKSLSYCQNWNLKKKHYSNLDKAHTKNHSHIVKTEIWKKTLFKSNVDLPRCGDSLAKNVTCRMVKDKQTKTKIIHSFFYESTFYKNVRLILEIEFRAMWE